MTAPRPELPDMPRRIADLPIDHRGYPVPWFVAWLDEDQVMPVGQGRADHRVARPGAVAEAIRLGCCWVCGAPLGAYKSFVVGPMCAVNRTSAEPPSHLDCAEWSARACPFLTRPHAKRREQGMPDHSDMPGLAIMRNPGVTLVWTTRTYCVRPAPNGILLGFGDPEHIKAYCEGRPATAEEIRASVDSGLPALRQAAERDPRPGAMRQLERQVEAAMDLLAAA